MKRLPISLAPLASIVVAASLYATAAGQSSSEAVASVSEGLPVSHVSLYTTGVAYFEHEGTVEGTVELALPVPTEHMDDLLGSLVLQDLDGGRILPVRYGSRDPLPRILSSYSLDLSEAPTLADLLDQARGEEVVLEAPERTSGTVVGVEWVEAPDAPRRAFLTLASEGGLRRIPLEEVRDVRFAREDLREELAAALDAIARHRDAEEATVRLRFEGDGERRVRVGYVRAMPVWKTSYRLVTAENGAADLQGWAIFDNPTDTDLVDVSVSFVAGSPASFVTRLYEPVYVERPRLEARSQPGLVPNVDAGATPPPAAQSRSAVAGDAVAETAEPFALQAPRPPGDAPVLLGAGVSSMAEGTAVGASFEYRVTAPVTVLRHESAMIPIVRTTVPAERLAHYDPRQSALHPARSVRLVNDTGLHLAAGPVAIFDDAGFAGTARLGDVPPGEARMLDFAVASDVRVRTDAQSEPQRVTAARFRNGLLETTVRHRIRTEYRIDAGTEDLFVLLDHPAQDGYEVVVPELPPSRTPDGYRFGVRIGDGSGADETTDATDADAVPTHATCSADGPCTFEVVQERVESQNVVVTSVTPDQIAFFLENVELSEEDRAALDRILERKREIVGVDRDLNEAQERLDAIHREQDRIRQNMAALDRNSTLYGRYLADLTAQEDELADLRETQEELRSRRNGLQAELDEMVGELGEEAGS